MTLKRFGPEYGIAPWKIDSSVERFLSYKADSSEFWKSIYVWFYRIFDAQYYKGGLKMIEKSLEINKEKLGGGNLTPSKRKQIAKDMIYSLHRFGCEFNEYFAYEFYRLNTEARDSFICSKKRWPYYLYFNGSRNNPIFDDKNLTYETFSGFIHRDYCNVKSIEDKIKFDDFENRVQTYLIKPEGGSGGRGVIIANHGDFTVEDLLNKYSKGFMAEEIIVNHDELSEINPSSLNTIRVVTIRKEKQTEIVYAFIRFGRKGSVVDNAFCGGIICDIDLKLGIVTSASTEAGERHIIHPDSKKPLLGLQIPFWQEVKETALKLADVLPATRYVGWDLAVTKAGVVMIEANCKGEFVNQIASARGIKSEIEKLMQ